jgi:hypothetical protein
MSVTRNITQITNWVDSDVIQFLFDDGNFVDTKKNLVKIKLDSVNDLVYMYDSSQSQIAKGVDVYEPNFYILKWQDITSPVVGSALALFTFLQTALTPATINYLPYILNDLNQMNSNIQLATYLFNNTINIVRPANATVYTIGDVLNDIVPTVFELVGVSQGFGDSTILESISVFDSNNAAVKPIFNYAFFKSPPPVMVDNTPISITDLFASTEFVGAVSVADFSGVLNPTALGGGNSVQTKNIVSGLPLLTELGFTSLWVVIYLANAYVPIARENFVFNFKTKFIK